MPVKSLSHKDFSKIEFMQAMVSALERHFTPKEIAEVWAVDENTVRRIFIDEPGVLRLGNKRRGKRSYFTLRIPAAVLERVYRERLK